MPECALSEPPMYRVGGSRRPLPALRDARRSGPEVSPAGPAASARPGQRRVARPRRLRRLASSRCRTAAAAPRGVRASPGTSGFGGLWSRRQLHAVDDVSFTIGRREIVALVGESGSGKSTIARLLAMVYEPTSGDIRFDGKPFDAFKRRKAEAGLPRRRRRWCSRTPTARSTPPTGSRTGSSARSSCTARSSTPRPGAPRRSG